MKQYKAFFTLIFYALFQSPTINSMHGESIIELEAPSWINNHWLDEDDEEFEEGCGHRAYKMFEAIQDSMPHAYLYNIDLSYLVIYSKISHHEGTLGYQSLPGRRWSWHVVLTYKEKQTRYIIDPLFRGKVFIYDDWLKAVTYPPSYNKWHVTTTKSYPRLWAGGQVNLAFYNVTALGQIIILKDYQGKHYIPHDTSREALKRTKGYLPFPTFELLRKESREENSKPEQPSNILERNSNCCSRVMALLLKSYHRASKFFGYPKS